MLLNLLLGPELFQTFWDKCGKTNSIGSDFKIINAIKDTDEDFNTFHTQSVEIKQDTPSTPSNLQLNLKSRHGMIFGIARGDMRKVFLHGCEDNIRWSHKVIGYESTSNGVHLLFSDGSKSEEGQMIVGGEGIYSHIAKQLTNGKIKNYDTGARAIHGQAPASAFKGLGEGVWKIEDDRHIKIKVFAIMNIRSESLNEPGMDLGWTLSGQPGVIKAPNDDYSAYGSIVAKMAKELTASWNPRLKPLFDNMIENEAAFWKITCSSPSGISTWQNDPRVTIIGDAVHSMTPAGGLGANTACRDAELLGRLISEAGGFKDGITAAYEEKMRAYGSKAVAQSYHHAMKQFGIKIDEVESNIVF